MDFLVDGGRRRHPQKKTAVYTGKPKELPRKLTSNRKQRTESGRAINSLKKQASL
jgi:hypothetical protein